MGEQADHVPERSLAFLQDLVENVHDLVQCVRPDGTFFYVNRAWREALGYDSGEVERLTLSDVIHPRSLAHCKQVLDRVLAGEDLHRLETTFRTKQGQAIEVEGSVHCRFEAGKPVACQSIFRDVTGRNRAEAMLAAEAKVLTRLSEGVPLAEVLEVLVRAIEEMTDGMFGSVLLLDEANRLRHGAAPSLPEEYCGLVDGLEIGPRVGSCGTAAYRREAVIVEDIATDPLWAGISQLALPHGLRACWSTPILSGGKVLGTFAQYYREPRRPTQSDLVLIARMTHLARIAIERTRAEEAFRASRSMLELVIDSIPQGVFWKDRDSVYLGCNLVVSRAAGLADPSQIRGRTDFTLPSLTRQQAEYFVLKDRMVMENNTPEYGIIETMTLADGNTICLETNKIPLRDADGRVVGVLGTWQDITERRKAVQALQASERKYRDIVETSHDLIWSVDVEGRWTFVNREGARTIYGCEPEEMLGRPFMEFVPPDVLKRDLITFANIKAGQPVFHYETQHFRKDGSRVFLNYNAIPWFSPEGQLLGSTGTAMDITERKRSEDERRKLELQLQRAQKLESLGVLAGGVAHDFNSLLTAIMGFASLAQANLPRGSIAGSMLQEIEKAASQAADLTKQMLAFSGRGKFVTQVVALDALVRDMGTLFETLVSKKARLVFDLKPALVEGDATQMRQVALNLVTNASDALGDREGTIFIRTETRHVDAASLQSVYIHEEVSAGEYAVLEVQDNGAGMDAETKSKVFEPFFTTKFTGRGLGLAAVLGIVRGHQGSIRVISKPDQGALFQIYLPAAKQAPTPVPEPTSEPEPKKAKNTILVVEDEDSIRKFTRVLLENAGFEVRLACDGQEGLEAFSHSPLEIDVIVLDWTMPRLDGAELVRKIREQRPGVPILIMSGFSEQEVSTSVARHGGATFIQKPFRPADLLDKVDRLLPSRSTANGGVSSFS